MAKVIANVAGSREMSTHVRAGRTDISFLALDRGYSHEAFVNDRGRAAEVLEQADTFLYGPDKRWVVFTPYVIERLKQYETLQEETLRYMKYMGTDETRWRCFPWGEYFDDGGPTELNQRERYAAAFVSVVANAWLTLHEGRGMPEDSLPYVSISRVRYDYNPVVELPASIFLDLTEDE